MILAPIILFVYNRPEHTRLTIEALQKNHLATASSLIIFSDHAKESNNVNTINEVRRYLKTITGFKNVTIIERKENFGLGRNIIEGVSEVVEKYGRVIVLEDDLITSPFRCTWWALMAHSVNLCRLCPSFLRLVRRLSLKYPVVVFPQ